MSKRDILQTRLTTLMKREVENALCRFLLDLDFKASDAIDINLKMYNLLKYLKGEHARWQPLDEDQMNTNKSKTVKAMRLHLIHFRKKVEDLEVLMEMQADRKDTLTDEKDILDVSAEFQDSARCSCEDS